MVCFHRRYKMGDEYEFATPDEFEEWWEPRDAKGLRLPIYMYEHSSIALSTAPFICPWDSGQLGWIYVLPEKIQSEYGDLTAASYDKAAEVLRAEVKEYGLYVDGSYVGYEITDPDGEYVASCWGYSDIGDCMEAAKEELAGILEPPA